MKKYFRLLGSLILMISLTGMLFAGGEGEKEAGSSAAKGQTLTIWSTLTQESRATELENIARMYEQANPGVKVEITVMPWSGAFDKMIAAIMAGNPRISRLLGRVGRRVLQVPAVSLPLKMLLPR